jgi:3-deoxy-7-phosphoheptulonate synthase
MIYNFEKSDPSGKRFIEVLEENHINYELIEHDRDVIRILGFVPPDLLGELHGIHEKKRTTVPEKRHSSDIYADFLDVTQPCVIAGPCSVESEEQISEAAAFLGSLGVRYIRGGAFKPRTSPDSFQGMGISGLRFISEEAHKHGLKVVSEVMDKSQIDLLIEYADVIQVGSRNMFNYTLLTALGSIDRPILLKRGMAATIEEWLSASEYIRRGGNEDIILCERGIRTFEPKTRNTLDISAICLAQRLCDYPVIADPSHATGDSDLVIPVALAALSAGADGIMVEIHPRPQEALSDKDQALTFDQFKALLEEIERRHPLPKGRPRRE